MNKPEFTPEEEDWICYQIGEWYLEFKNKLCDYDGRVNSFGRAKEVLKNRLCDIGTDYNNE